MPNCQNCGSHVTTAFARVFGDNEDVVYGCNDCMDRQEAVRHRNELPVAATSTRDHDDT